MTRARRPPSPGPASCPASPRSATVVAPSPRPGPSSPSRRISPRPRRRPALAGGLRRRRGGPRVGAPEAHGSGHRAAGAGGAGHRWVAGAARRRPPAEDAGAGRKVGQMQILAPSPHQGEGGGEGEALSHTPPHTPDPAGGRSGLPGAGSDEPALVEVEEKSLRQLAEALASAPSPRRPWWRRTSPASTRGREGPRPPERHRAKPRRAEPRRRARRGAHPEGRPRPAPRRAGAGEGQPRLRRRDEDDRRLTGAARRAHAARDAFVVQRLREAGAVLLGKTNLSEWRTCAGAPPPPAGAGGAG